MGNSVTLPESHGHDIALPPLAGVYFPTALGFTMYWVTFFIMAASALIFFAQTMRLPMHQRKTGYLTTGIAVTASVAYFAMATHGGHTFVRLYWQLDEARAVFYARYIDWLITTPLLLLDLLVIASAPVGTAVWILTADVAMIATGLFGALSTYSYRWAWFAFGCIFQLVLSWGLFVPGQQAAFKRSGKIGRLYLVMMLYLLFLWAGYPVVWVLAEGSNIISPDIEIICYGILDILAKPVFGILLMLQHITVKKQMDEEDKQHKLRPSILEAPLGAPLSSVVAYLGSSGHHTDPSDIEGTIPLNAPLADQSA